MKGSARPVAVIGAGTMGHGIGMVVARAGLDVRLHDADPQALVWAKSRIEYALGRSVARGNLSREQREGVLDRIRLVDDLGEALEGVAFAIESVTEDADVKRSAFVELDRLAPDDAVLASNTSALSITLIGSWTRSPERVVGLHFFNPPDRMPFVEIVRGVRTSERTIGSARALCDRLDKETIVVADRPGFATSRLSASLGNEAWYMFMEGVASPAEIDKAVKLALGHPMGPFELGDLIGLDVRLSVLRTLHEELGERFRPCPLLVKYVEAGHLGRKTGRGVYEYHDVNEQPDG